VTVVLEEGSLGMGTRPVPKTECFVFQCILCKKSKIFMSSNVIQHQLNPIELLSMD